MNQLYACKPNFKIWKYNLIEIKSIFDYNDTIKAGQDLNHLFFTRNYYFDSISNNQVFTFDKISVDNINKSGLESGISIYLRYFPKNDSAKFRIKMKVNGKEIETTTPTMYFQYI